MRKLGIADKTRTVTAKEAIDVVSNHNALIKNIATNFPDQEPAFNDVKNSFAFLVRQLADPENYRPAKTVPKGADRSAVLNPQTQQWERRTPKPAKGQPKPNCIYTKKTATSLLPPSGALQLFSQTHGIALLFDLRHCKIKQYIFESNALTNDRWWLGDLNRASPHTTTQLRAQRSVTLDQLRDKQMARIALKETLLWNEILADLSAQAVIGICVPENNLTCRLNAQYRRLILLRELNIVVPIFIQSETQNIVEYTPEQQSHDLSHCTISEVNGSFVSAINKFELEHLAQIGMAPNIFTYIEEDNRLALAFALQTNAERIIKKQNLMGQTPIEVCALKNKWDFVSIIASAQKSDHTDTARYGRALLAAILKDQSDLAIQLITQGASLNVSIELGQDKIFIIHLACIANDPRIIKKLLEIDQSIVDKETSVFKKTPLEIAMGYHRLDAIKLLLTHGAKRTNESHNLLLALLSSKDLTLLETYLSADNKLKLEMLSALIAQHNPTLEDIQLRRQLNAFKSAIEQIVERELWEEAETQKRKTIFEEIKAQQIQWVCKKEQLTRLLIEKGNTQHAALQSIQLLKEASAEIIRSFRHTVKIQSCLFREAKCTQLTLSEEKNRRAIFNEAANEFRAFTLFAQGEKNARLAAVQHQLSNFVDSIRKLIDQLSAEIVTLEKEKHTAYSFLAPRKENDIATKTQKKDALTAAQDLFETLRKTKRNFVTHEQIQFLCEALHKNTKYNDGRTGELMKKVFQFLEKHEAKPKAADSSAAASALSR